MVPNIAGIIVKPIDFCYVTCVCISGELRAIYPCALSYPNAVPYSLIVYLRMYTCTCKSYIFKRDQKCGNFCIMYTSWYYNIQKLYPNKYSYSYTNTYSYTYTYTYSYMYIVLGDIKNYQIRYIV